MPVKIYRDRVVVAQGPELRPSRTRANGATIFSFSVAKYGLRKARAMAHALHYALKARANAVEDRLKK